jgi:DNA (cytosine-5)-methyltransferase 1
VRILDLFCKAGGASMGYHMAGFDVVGVDIEPQPNYPFKFYQRDALTLDPRRIRARFDAVVASPPCLGYTTLASRYPHIQHAKLIPATRDLLEATRLPYIIENVANARKDLIEPVQLCGSSFGLRVQRHRLFETNFDITTTPACTHEWQNRHRTYEIYMTKERGGSRWSGAMPIHGTGYQLRTRDDWYRASVAMGIDWMTRLELNQAIPPLYTHWLGRQLKRWLES